MKFQEKENDKFLRMSEVRDKFNISYSKLIHWMKEGNIRYTKIAHILLFSEQEIIQAIKNYNER